MRRTLLLLALPFAPMQPAHAQQPADPISGKASLGYLATDGNTNSTNANAAFNLEYARENWTHEFDLSAVLAETDGQTTAESYSFAYEARRDYGEKSYLFATVDWKSDRFSSFDETVSESAGYGRRLIETDAHALSVEVGGGARQAVRRDATEEDDAIVRATLDYVFSVNDTTSFSQDLVVESGSSNTSVESVSELRARMFGNVALVLSYRLRRNSDVLPGTEATDRFTAISLEYAF